LRRALTAAARSSIPSLPPTSLPPSLLPSHPSSRQSVRRADQEAINEFGRLNLRRGELRAELAELEKRALELGDAEEACLLADESAAGAVKIMVGECFVDATPAEAAEHVQRELAAAARAREALGAEAAAADARMAALKKQLYGRFGKSINLED
jgi:prefoldin subunit 4